jgi:hypothetical protein
MARGSALGQRSILDRATNGEDWQPGTTSTLCTTAAPLFALTSLFNILFAGVTFILLGLAVARSGEYSRWLGWVVVVAGVGSMPVGLVQAYTGESIGFTRIATIIFPTIITLWMVGMSVLVLRNAASASREIS